MVIATQNPVDHEGTFPLPEAQLDRFLIKLSLGYPTIEEEALMLKRLQFGHPIDDVVPVVSSADWIACQEVVRKIHLDDQIRTYILEIVHGTRDNENILLGGSPGHRFHYKERHKQALQFKEEHSWCLMMSRSWLHLCFRIELFSSQKPDLGKLKRKMSSKMF